MKEIFISEIEKYLEQEVMISVLLKDIDYSENRSQNKWLEAKLVDKTGELISRIWGELINTKYIELKGKIVKVMGLVHIYQDKPEIQVIAMEEDTEFDWLDYVQTLDKEVITNCYESIKTYINMVSDPSIKALLTKFFDDKKLEKLSSAIGGTLHHNYFGGLLVHLVETCTAAVQKTMNKSLSPYATDVNLDLIIAGALLHDVGKLSKYGGFPYGERTTRGYLVSASDESLIFTTLYNNSIPADKRVKDTTPLDHIILTAETMDENGRLPRTLEAVIVNQANRESFERDGYDMTFYIQDRKRGLHKTNVFSKINKTLIFREV